MSGLEETVTISKSPSAVYATRADGSRQSLGAMNRENRERLRARYGALSPRFAATLNLGPDTAEHRIAIVMRDDAPRDVHQRLRHPDPNTRQLARTEFAQSISSNATTLLSAVPPGVLRETRVVSMAPFIFATGTAADIRDLARRPEIAGIYSAVKGTPEEHASQVPPDDVLQLTGWLGDNGIDVEGRIAIIDPGAKCRFDSAHTVFASNGIALSGSGTSQTCSSSTNCASGCGACIGGICRDVHATMVASVIAQLAPSAVLEHPLEDVDVSCDGQERALVFDGLVENGVRVVNESYSCSQTAGIFGEAELQGIVEDYYARVHNIVVTKSAGNRDGNANQEACWFTLNSVCVGGVASTLDKACFSAWKNPGTFALETPYDREEPDVMAFSGAGPNGLPNCDLDPLDTVKVATPGSGTGYEGQTGTSLAAPAIAALSQALIEVCASEGKSLSATLIRAILRTAAWHHNPVGWRYSTLTQTSGDHQDGAGFVLAPLALAFCVPAAEGPNVWSGDLDIDLDTDDGFPAPEEDEYEFDEPPGGTSTFSGPGLSPMDQGWVPVDGGRFFKNVAIFDDSPQNYGSLDAGDRVRVTFTWDACTTSNTGEAPAPILVDYDLILFSTTLGKTLFISQTTDDNAEGFDVTIPAGWGGDYQVLISWPTSQQTETCGAEHTSLAMAWGPAF